MSTEGERPERGGEAEPRPSLAIPRRYTIRPPSARLFASIVLGAVAASGFAIVMRGSLDAVTHALFGDARIVTAFRGLPWWARLVAPAIGAAIGGFIGVLGRRLPESRGLGDVMEAVVLGRGRVSLRASLAKTASSFAALAGGGSIGREGPLIQVGAALGGAVGARLRLGPSEARIAIASGIAAGFASAYNTPLTAALFVLEIVTGFVTLDVLVPVLVASAIGTALSRAALGDGPFYGERSYALEGPEAVLAALALGPLGGLLATGVVRLLAVAERGFQRLAASPVLRAGLGGLSVGALAMVVPEVVGNGAEPIREMLDGHVLGLAFLALLAAKLLATTASVGSGGAGGIFTPTMFLGAALGGGLGSLVVAATDQVDPSLAPACALVGMAVVVAGTTHAPLMASVLAFEMSGDYAIVVPLLVGTALATSTSRWLGSESVYVAELRRHGTIPRAA